MEVAQGKALLGRGDSAGHRDAITANGFNAKNTLL